MTLNELTGDYRTSLAREGTETAGDRSGLGCGCDGEWRRQGWVLCVCLTAKEGVGRRQTSRCRLQDVDF